MRSISSYDCIRHADMDCQWIRAFALPIENDWNVALVKEKNCLLSLNFYKVPDLNAMLRYFYY